MWVDYSIYGFQGKINGYMSGTYGIPAKSLTALTCFKASTSFTNVVVTALKPASAILYEMRSGPTTACSFEQAK